MSLRPLMRAVGALTLTALCLTQAQPVNLLNIDFGARLFQPPKVGPAAIGLTPTDYWNNYGPYCAQLHRDMYGVLPNLKWSDGRWACAHLQVGGLPRALDNTAPDSMFATYLTHALGSGWVGQAVVSGLPGGVYDVYIYGHGVNNADNGVYQLNASGYIYGVQANVTDDSWKSEEWALGRQVVYFPGVSVADEGSLTVLVYPGAGGRAALSGLQIVQSGAIPPPPPPQPSYPIYSRVLTGAIAEDGGNSIGAAWGDYDADGYLDLFVTRDGWGNRLYRNLGNGTFESVNNEVTQGTPNSNGCAWGDYDNDGYLDLFVANRYGQISYLYRNRGDGTFEQVFGGDLSLDYGDSTGAAWGDFDNDGDLDLVVSDLSGSSRMYRNDGGNTFTRLWGHIVETVPYGTGCAWGDYDHDGRADLFLTSGANWANHLFHNEGDGAFTPVTGSPVNTGGYSVGCAWADYDNDGHLDLFVANRLGVNFLYRNLGDGQFEMVYDPAITSDYADSNGCAWADVDNDGDQDLFVANFQSQLNALYLNGGAGGFTKVLDAPTAEPNNATTATWGDYDGDGFVDLYVGQWPGGISSQLFHNKGNANHWVNVKLVATQSNRASIGARVTLTATIDGAPRTQVREITSSDGWRDQGLIACFGLADAIAATTIVVEWPSGTTAAVTDVPAGQTVTVVEP